MSRTLTILLATTALTAALTGGITAANAEPDVNLAGTGSCCYLR